MNRFALFLILSTICFTSYGQGHTIYSDDDPAFGFIQTYMPEYYFEEYSNGKHEDIEVIVRTLFNYEDDRTFTYYALSTQGVWDCIEIDEIDSIVNYLKRVSDRSSAPSANATMVYNTRRGFKFEAEKSSFGGRTVTLYFPNNGPKCTIRNPEGLAKVLDKGKKYVKYDTQFVFRPDSPSSEHGYYATNASARLRMRYVVGSLPKPRDLHGEKGVIVVQITVDQFGNVTEATPGAKGTTLFDEDLLNEARNAALKAHFNASDNASEVQTGTITYRFNIQEGY